MQDETLSPNTREVRDSEWSHAAAQPAGIFWLDGRSVIAALNTRAEQRLLAAGAVPIATLIFDLDPIEGIHPGHSVERMSTRDMYRTIARPVGN